VRRSTAREHLALFVDQLTRTGDRVFVAGFDPSLAAEAPRAPRSLEGNVDLCGGHNLVTLTAIVSSTS
jgi:hypothetical protein